MSLKSPTQTLFNQDGYAVAVKDGLTLSENNAALLLAGSDGTDTHYIALDSNGRSLISGAGTAGTPEGGILSLQGVAGGQDLPVNISNFPADQSIVQDNAAELLASVGGLGASGSATVGNPVRLGVKNDADGTTLDLVSDSSGRLVAVGAAADGDAVTGSPIRIGASDGNNAVDVLSDASGRLVFVGAAADGSAVSGAPILTAGSDGADTQSLLTDSDGRLIIAGAAADGAAVAGNPVRLGASDGTNTQNILSDSQGRLIRVGAAATGSAPSGNPLLAGGTDGTNAQIFKLDNAGALQVSQVKCSDATLYTTTATTSAASLLASNIAREGAIVYNNSNRFLYVKLGSSITYSSFTTKIAPFGQYLVPSGFTGEISGTWNDATATGSAIVTEFAPGGGGGGGGGGPTDPSLTSLMAWYRADDIGLSNGGSVTGWVDRQGPSDLTRALNGNAIYNASNSDFNNRPTVNFDAGQKQLDTYDNASFNFGPQLAGNTIIVVVKPTYSPIFGFERIIEVEGAYPNFGQGYSIYQGNYGGASIFSQGGSSSGRITKTVEPNKALILYLSYEYGTNATQNTLQIFGGASTYEESQSHPGIGTAAVMPIAPAGRLIVGGASPGANIAEILYYNAVQGAQEKTDTIAYLSSRYGITV